MSKQSDIKFIYLRLCLKKRSIFQTAPGTDDDIAMTTCAFDFFGYFLFIFLTNIQNKKKFTHTNFPIHWMTIMRDITKLHKLSERPTYI